MNFILILAASIWLGWDDPNPQGSITHIELYMGVQSIIDGNPPLRTWTCLTPAIRQEVDGLELGTTYYFVTRAWNGNLGSVYSNEVSYTPMPPIMPTPTPESIPIPTPTPEPIPIPEPTVEPLPIPLPTATPILTATPEPTIEPVASATPTPEVFPTPNPSSSRFWFYEAWWRRYFNLPDPSPSPSPN